MASKLLGRCTCPVCDDDKAHVKIKTDKGEGVEAYPYMHCRECGLQMHTKNRQQAELLLKKTRPEKGAEPEPNTPPVSEAGTPAGPAQAKPAPAVSSGGLSRSWRSA